MADIPDRAPIPSLKLNDGNSIPMLGFGTGTAYYKTGDESKLDQSCIDAVKSAIKVGYYHLDGAEAYKTETELGMAIKESGVAREKLFVTTKVADGIEDVKGAIERSLKKLGVDYVDLYLIHSPFFADNGKDEKKLQAAWKAMEDVQAAGKAKSIGVSNFLPQHFEAIMKTAKVTPAMNQIEFHPYLQHPDLLSYHKSHSIATSAYSPLTAATKGAPGPCDSYLSSLAEKYGVSPNEISLRWCIDQDIVPITTSSKEERMSDMLRVATFKLTPREIRELGELGAQKHYRRFWTHVFAEDDRS